MSNKPVYIQFIGSIPNSLEFCDVVTKNGFSINVGQWESFSGNEKRLGPFYTEKQNLIPLTEVELASIYEKSKDYVYVNIDENLEMIFGRFVVERQLKNYKND